MQTNQPRSPIAGVKSDLLSALPKLRAFAISLCGRSGGGADRADDLVQETVLKALANISSFEPGTNMAGWLYTILRNEFYSDYRKRSHEVQDEDGIFAAQLRSKPAQEGHMHFLELDDAMNQLEPEYREALILVAAAGNSYQEAAKLCACAIGTVKSRVHRARAKLAVLLTPVEQSSERRITWNDDPPRSRDRALTDGIPMNGGTAGGVTSAFAAMV